jgi:hypothetical protein
LFSFTLSLTLSIESLDNIFFLYHVMGLAPSHSHKNLLLMYMYTKSSARFDVDWIHTLLWTNEYEFQFCSNNDLNTLESCTKLRWAMGAKVHPLVPIKSHHLCGSKSRSFTRGLFQNGPQLLTKYFKARA